MIKMIPAAQIGPILITDFSSSTLWTVLSFHRLGFPNSSPIFTFSSSVTTAALSRNLHRNPIIRMITQCAIDNLTFIDVLEKVIKIP